jgi:mannose-1-phosphate guanylyltransferase
MRVVILAGGSGSRLWPMSRSDVPKQFCKLTSDKTMLEETLDRFKDYPAEKKFIATTEQLVEEIKEILPNFPKENIIVEPEKRDTAPAMGFNAVHLGLRDMDEPMVFVASDQQIGKVNDFLNCLDQAEKVINETGKMLDISIYPTEPNTALGYTKVGKKVEEKDGVEFYEFLGHKEKPDFETAKRYLKEGDYFWHANYYMWTPRKFMEAYEQYAPEMHKTLKEIEVELKGEARQDKVTELYGQMEKISIDYAIAEKMNPKDVLIIKGEFGWRDIGTWDTLYENLLPQSDEQKNVIKADSIAIDTNGSMIYGKQDKVIATIGVDDMLIVDTDDALLVCPKSRAQDVKKVIEKLKKRGDGRV